MFNNNKRQFVYNWLSLISVIILTGCQGLQKKNEIAEQPMSEWKETNPGHLHLTTLPEPVGKIAVSVYNFRDQSGQYKSAPSSSFSTAVTQGATSILTKALSDSGWFVPLEREGLQNILTERKIIRVGLEKKNVKLPPLMTARVLLEGGIIGYDSNIKTGGAGAKYFGLGAQVQYRVDQVTVSLRAVDVQTGQVIQTVTTTKKVLSKEVTSGLFRFIKFKRLLEMEAGYTSNEPALVCVQDAIETAVIRLVVEGIGSQHWALKDQSEKNHPLLKMYSI